MKSTTKPAKPPHALNPLRENVLSRAAKGRGRERQKQELSAPRETIASLRAELACASEKHAALAHTLSVETQNAAQLRADLQWLRNTLPGAAKFLDYKETISAAQQMVSGNVPSGSTVLVANKGDEKLLVHDVPAWHFPRNADGTYTWHYPADSAEAIIHLESLRSKGADFLLLPRTGLWWLDHYPLFRVHMEKRFHVAARDSFGVLFDLRNPVLKRAARPTGSATVGDALVVIPGSVNYFYDEIGHRLSGALRELGHVVETCTLAEARERTARWCLLVNPYEIAFGYGERDKAVEEIARLRARCGRTAAVLLECTATPWFAHSISVCQDAGVTSLLDLGFHGQHDEIAPELRSGYQFVFSGLTRGEWQALGKADGPRKRAIPWAFVGHAAEKRVSTLHQLLRVEPHGFVYMPRLGPTQRDGPHLNEDQFLNVLRKSRCQVWNTHHEHFYLESERFRSSLLTGALPVKIVPALPRKRPFIPFDYLLIEEDSLAEGWGKLDVAELWQRFAEDFAVLPLLEETLGQALQNLSQGAKEKGASHAD